MHSKQFLAVLILALLPLAAIAQQRKVIHAGDGPDPELVRRWPKTDVRPGMTDAEISAEVDRYVERLSKDNLFSGAVLVAHKGQVLSRKAVGMANRDFMVANTPDTKFNLGSINKLFTTLAIGRLMQDGKLKPSDTVASLLPGTSIPSADKITVAHLLTHRSGLGDIFTDKWASMRGELTANADYFPLFEKDPLQFPPGTDQRYSNAGFVVLGAIVEKLSGQPYYDYVREQVFKPAGMTMTDSFMVGQIVPNRAVGYTRHLSQTDELRANTITLPARGSAAGGGYSTIDDLYRLATALTSNRILSPEYSSRVLNGTLSNPGSGTGHPAGLGVAGGSPGVNAVLEMDTARDFVIVVLGNYDPPSATLLSRNLRALFGVKVDD